MCGPAAIGVAQFAVGAMSAVAQHKEAQAAAARQNAINQQQYQRNLQIARNNDQANKKAYEGQLKAQAEAITAYNKELALNQVEADRAANVARQEKKEKGTEAAFKTEKLIATAIQSQGKLLSTGNAGQSFLLQTLQADRELGMASAQIDQTLYDANLAFARDLQGVAMGHYAADSQAYNNLPADPQARQASFIPMKPIKVKGPSGLSLMAGIAGAAVQGASTGYGLSLQKQQIAATKAAGSAGSASSLTGGSNWGLVGSY